jgi:hypothetical protein
VGRGFFIRRNREAQPWVGVLRPVKGGSYDVFHVITFALGGSLFGCLCFLPVGLRDCFEEPGHNAEGNLFVD